jgi:adenylate cyclase
LQTKDISLTADKFGVAQIKVGDLDIPVDNKGNFLINYYGGPKTFPHISISDIILGKVGQETLEGRIVLVGATGKGIFDLRATPFERIYPGVEINATIIDNILQGNYLRKPLGYLTYNYLLVLLIGLVLSFAISRLKALPGLLLMIFFLISNYFFNQWMFNRGTLVNLVYPTLQILGVYLSITGYNYFSESKQRQFIYNAFGQYLSPTVIKRLINNPDMLKLGGEQKRMTAFFSDVTSFSTISENLTPTQLVKLLNEYLSTMTDIILKHDGTIDKYEGDAIIAFFGAPVDYPEHALRACLASIEMQKTLEQMREVWQSQGRSQLTARMGINTGVMLVGNMGSTTRMDYTVMGDAVNLASRLEGVNKVYGTNMIISHFTFEDVRTAVQVRELDYIRVVGKTEPVKNYEIIGKKGETPELILKALERFAKGRELYRKQEWALALERFHEIEQLKPNDRPAQVFIQRCEEFVELERKNGNKVFSENWDGVYQMTSK